MHSSRPDLKHSQLTKLASCPASHLTCLARPGDVYRFIVYTKHHELDFVAFSLVAPVLLPCLLHTAPLSHCGLCAQIIVVFALIAWGTHQTTIINSIMKVTACIAHMVRCKPLSCAQSHLQRRSAT